LPGFLIRFLLTIQDFYLLTGRAIRNIFRKPHYTDDIILQMDSIGVGSLLIVVLTGFFSGAVMTLQLARALARWGQKGQVGTAVSITLVRELGPALTALMVAGRNSSGMASELGSMKVTEQIDAMRALGTDPTKKLVTPRVVATVVMLFFLTIISDLLGLVGGNMVSSLLLGLDSRQYWTSAWQSLVWRDLTSGLIKPVLFGFVISTVGCYFGMSTRGGTQGVGRSTTQAVVVASVMILVTDFFVTKLLITVLGYR
jgi:phospholipid/cholesterol/gamma-HCH transport system permease protein